jgi:hypothetical protein
LQPIYVTVTSSGSSPWKLTNWHANPVNLGIGVRTSGLTSNWQLDVTLDDPTNTFPSSAGPTIFSSLVSGSTNAIASITFPIAAWRLTNTSTAGTVTATVLQSGIG